MGQMRREKEKLKKCECKCCAKRKNESQLWLVPEKDKQVKKPKEKWKEGGMAITSFWRRETAHKHSSCHHF
jgi:hypothetical protein